MSATAKLIAASLMLTACTSQASGDPVLNPAFIKLEPVDEGRPFSPNWIYIRQYSNETIAGRDNNLHMLGYEDLATIFGNVAWSNSDNHIIGRGEPDFPDTVFRLSDDPVKGVTDFINGLELKVDRLKKINTRGVVEVVLFERNQELLKFKNEFLKSRSGSTFDISQDSSSCFYGLSDKIDEVSVHVGVLFIKIERGVLDLNRATDAACIQRVFSRNLGLSTQEVHELIFPNNFKAERPCVIVKAGATFDRNSNDCPTAPFRRYEVFAAYLEARGAGITDESAIKYLDWIRGACEYGAQSGYDLQEYCRKFIEGAS